jgi:predicted transcriptional regulator
LKDTIGFEGIKMNKKEDILQMNTRKIIYDTILENPGIHQRALERKTKIPSGTLRYHTLRLIKNNIISKKCDNGYSRYFIKNNIDNGDKKIINLLRQKVPRKIIIRIIIQKGSDSHTKEQIRDIQNKKYWRKEDLERYSIKLNLRTINYHLQKLIDAGIIERIREGRQIRYRIVDEDKILDLLIRYQDTFDDLLVRDSIESLESKRYQKFFAKSVSGIVDSLKDTFPPPFYI